MSDKLTELSSLEIVLVWMQCVMLQTAWIIHKVQTEIQSFLGISRETTYYLPQYIVSGVHGTPTQDDSILPLSGAISDKLNGIFRLIRQ